MERRKKGLNWPSGLDELGALSGYLGQQQPPPQTYYAPSQFGMECFLNSQRGGSNPYWNNNAYMAQQYGAMDAYAAQLLAEMQRPNGVVPVPDEFGRSGRWVFPPTATEAKAPEQKAEPKFEDAFVYRPKVEPKKPFDWTLPLPDPWAGRFAKLYFAMVAATPIYVLWALLV